MGWDKLANAAGGAYIVFQCMRPQTQGGSAARTDSGRFARVADIHCNVCATREKKMAEGKAGSAEVSVG